MGFRSRGFDVGGQCIEFMPAAPTESAAQLTQVGDCVSVKKVTRGRTKRAAAHQIRRAPRWFCALRSLSYFWLVVAFVDLSAGFAGLSATLRLSSFGWLPFVMIISPFY